MSNPIKIGVFFQNYLPLLISRQTPNLDFFYFVGENSLIKDCVKKIIPEEKIIYFKLKRQNDPLSRYSSSEIIKKSNFPQLIKENKINYLIPSFLLSPFVQNWGKKNGIKIIFTDSRFKILENKIYFDQFLKENDLPKPASGIVNFPGSKITFSDQTCVIQDPTSSGGYGTFFVKSQNEVQKMLDQGLLKPNKNYLIREFVKGPSYGISVFISPKIIALSAARKQCFQKLTNHSGGFLGMQWETSLPSKTIEQINATFGKIGNFLFHKGFLGFANFDFIVSENGNIFIIECNPRFSDATAHLLVFPQLISGLPVGKLFIESFVTKRPCLKPKFYPYPDSTFSGSVLNIRVFADKKNPYLTKRDFKSGLYLSKNGGLDYLSPDPREMSLNEKQLIFFSQVKTGQVYKETSTIAYSLSNYALFNNDGQVNAEGEKILKSFRY